MEQRLKLEIVTPHRKVIETDADSVTLPGTEGEMTILPEHIPLLTTLDTGIVSYELEKQSQALVVHWGYAQVSADRVTVLAELAERADEIDVERAKQAEKKAREILSDINLSAEDWDSEQHRMTKYEFKLGRALVRQHISTFK